MSSLRKKHIPRTLDKHFGERVEQAKYPYSSIFLYWIYSIFCGAERLYDTKPLKEKLDSIPGLSTPSPDRLADIFKSWAQPVTTFTNKDKEHQFAFNMPLNQLLHDTIHSLGTLNKHRPHTLDYDNVIIDTLKYDSCFTYIKTRGYQPGVAFIKNTPVYIEGRNGNSNAAFRIKESIAKALQLCKDNNITINRFRSDAAGYNKNVIQLLDENNIEFFIRCPFSRGMCFEVIRWRKLKIKHYTIKVANFIFHINEKPYRVVVSQTVSSDYVYVYRAIVTNNLKWSSKQVIEFYNQRGAMERNFDDLKNNFNWRRPPFSFLNENTVFLIISAIAKIIYQYLLKEYCKKMDFLKRNFRLKNFITHFISVSSQWIRGRLILYTEKKYPKIFS